MIGGLEAGLRYGGVAGQVPWLHSWTMGNPWVGKLLAAQPFIHAPDPLRTMVQASDRLIQEDAFYLIWIQFTQTCIDDYDRQPAQQHGDRPDFLAWLRSEETKGKPMSNRDIMNHLSNNLSVPEYPTCDAAYCSYSIDLPGAIRRQSPFVRLSTSWSKTSQCIGNCKRR